MNSTYHQAIKANGIIFVAGQIGLDPATGELISSDIAEQARQAIENTAMILKAAGSSLANAVSTTLYLTELRSTRKVNAVYAEYFPQQGRRSCLRRERALRRRQFESRPFPCGV